MVFNASKMANFIVRKSKGYNKNLTFCSSLEIGCDEYTWKDGTHQVKSIKEVDGKVRIEGRFTSKFVFKGDTQVVSGDYRIISHNHVHVH